VQEGQQRSTWSSSISARGILFSNSSRYLAKQHTYLHANYFQQATVRSAGINWNQKTPEISTNSVLGLLRNNAKNQLTSYLL